MGVGVGAGGEGAVITELDRAGQDGRAGTGPGPAASSSRQATFFCPFSTTHLPHPRAAPTHSPGAQGSLCWLLGGGGQTRDPEGECEEMGGGHEALQRRLGIKRVCDLLSLNNPHRSALWGKGRGPSWCFWSRGTASKRGHNSGILAEG